MNTIVYPKKLGNSSINYEIFNSFRGRAFQYF